MTERPILFSGPMVRALLAGTKTQTRRALKRQPADVIEVASGNHLLDFRISYSQPDGVVPMSEHAKTCPYGQPSDRLWVRETWQGPLLKEFETDADADWHTPARIHQYQNPAHCAYAADGGPAPEFLDLDDNLQQRWRPSIHMPRWASRLTLDLVSVRVERLQDISEADALAEGIVRQPDGGYGLADTTHYHATDPRICYWSLWDHINGAGSVEKNPVVWVLDFPQPTPNQPAQP